MLQAGENNPLLSGLALESGGNLEDIKNAVEDTVGFQIPAYDTQVIDESDPNNVTIVYSLSGVTVATKLIAVDGTTTTITVT